jgi:outer membrane usher protein
MGYRWTFMILIWAIRGYAQAADPPTWQAAPLEVFVNAQPTGQLLVALRETPSVLWLEAGDFHSLRLRLPDAVPRTYEGRQYYPLNAVAGLTLAVDEAHQHAVLQVPAAALETSARLNEPNRVATLTPASPGVFFNYQLSAQHLFGRDTEGALTKLGLFGPGGVLTDSAAVRVAASTAQAVRLDTTYTHDFPERLETLTLGDAISNPGSWGDAVRFAGFHWGSNFGIRPDLITAPLLSVAGSAVVPSTVDVLINNQRVSSQPIPPGPFVINNVPPLTGAGQVSVLVRDALGRTQLITQSFYSGTSLLARGLSQYSVDLGPIRENYALQSAQYGSLVSAVTYRRGLSDELTLEGHGEFQAHDAHAAGLNAAVRTGTLGIATVTVAEGGAAGKSGWLGGVSFEHHASIVSLTASTLLASEGFRNIGNQELLGERFKQRTLLQAGFNLKGVGSLSLAYVRQTFPSQPSQETSSLSYYVSLGWLGALGLTVSRSTGANTSTSAFLSLTCSLGSRDAIGVNAQGGQGLGAPRNELLAMLSHSPPVGPGEGYHISASTAGDYDADWQQQFSGGDIEIRSARNQGVTGQSVQADGTITWLGGEFHASRTVPGSFAAVDVGGLPNIPVYVENQLVAHTDESGRALLPNLLPYAANRISINPVELPLDTTINARSLTVAPPFSSGVILHFPVERVRAGTFQLITQDGKPVPAGATVKLNNGTFPVVLDGMVYVTGFDHGMGALAQWPGGECRFRLEPPPHDDPLPDMGRILCRASSVRPP